VPTPGHTGGSVSVLTDDGDLVAGDLIATSFMGSRSADRRPGHSAGVGQDVVDAFDDRVFEPWVAKATQATFDRGLDDATDCSSCGFSPAATPEDGGLDYDVRGRRRRPPCQNDRSPVQTPTAG
jgi:hypothetical protein